MISKTMIKFRTKLRLQIPLQFYKTVEKVETCDGNGQNLFNLHILVPILFFHD